MHWCRLTDAQHTFDNNTTYALHAIYSSLRATVNCDFKPFTKIHYQCIVHDHKLRRMSQTVKHLWFYSMYMIMILLC